MQLDVRLMAAKDAAGSEAHGSRRCSWKGVSWQQRMQLEVRLKAAGIRLKVNLMSVSESHDI
jgi:hypothetical protein